MTNVIKKDKKWIVSLFVTVLICYIPRMLIGFVLTPYAIYDEGTVLSTAAYLAGKDWSSVASVSAYYGFGYYALFAPILKLTDNPYTIYFIICEVNAFVQAFYGIIAFFIMRKFFKIDKTFIVTVIACICSYLTTVRPVVYNEVPLVLLNWSIAYLLCSLVCDRCSRKRKNIDTIFLFIAIAYSLTIHTRSIILLMGLVVVVLIYWFIYKEWLVSLKIVPLGIIVVVSAKYCVNLVQNIIWNAGERSSVANTSINLGIGKVNLLDITTWKGFFLVFIGQVSTINLFSGGLFIMALYILIKYAIINRKSFTEDKNRYYIVLSLLFLLCCFGMVAGQGISWMYAIYPSLIKHDIGNVQGYKAFSYIRYMGAFMGPFIFCSMAIAQKEKSLLKKIDFVKIVFFQLVVLLLWNAYVLPLLDGNPYALEPYAPFCFRKAHDVINIEQYRAALPWMLIIIVFIVTVILWNDFKVYYVFALGLLIFEVSYMAVYNDSYYGEERSVASAVCYDFFNELSSKCEVPKTIYSYGIDMQRLQFYLNNYEIEPNVPEKVLSDTILIYQGRIEEFDSIEIEKWNYISLDNDTYFFFQQEDYIDIIESMGYEVL